MQFNKIFLSNKFEGFKFFYFQEMIIQHIKMQRLLSCLCLIIRSMFLLKLPKFSNMEYVYVCFLNVFNNLKNFFYMKINHETFSPRKYLGKCMKFSKIEVFTLRRARASQRKWTQISEWHACWERDKTHELGRNKQWGQGNGWPEKCLLGIRKEK